MSAVPTELRDRLIAHDERLDASLGELIEAIDGLAAPEGARRWDAFDKALRDHLALEEKFLIQSVSRAHPRDARAIVAEHRYIRASLSQLTESAHTGKLRASDLRELAYQLNAHAQHEDALLYRWADHHLTSEERTSLAAALDDALSGHSPSSSRG